MASGRAAVVEVESASSPVLAGVGVKRDSYRLEISAHSRRRQKGGGVQTKHEIIIQKYRMY